MATTSPETKTSGLSVSLLRRENFRPRLYERKTNEKLTAIGKDGVRRIVTPYLSPGGQIGWIARENADLHTVTAYPIKRLDTHDGRAVMRAVMRAIAAGEMEVRGARKQWDPRIKQAVVFAESIELSHSSDHKKFRLDSFPEYRVWLDPPPSRRSERIRQMVISSALAIETSPQAASAFD